MLALTKGLFMHIVEHARCHLIDFQSYEVTRS